MGTRFVGALATATFLAVAGLTAVPGATGQAPPGYKASLLTHKRSLTRTVATKAVTGVHCIGSSATVTGGRPATISHDLGLIGANRVVTIEFDSDFDPVAVVIAAQLGEAAPNGVSNLASFSDDDSGGNLEPKLMFAAPFTGNYILVVGSSSTLGGCYVYDLVLT